MEKSDVVRALAEAMHAGSCVPVLGAGVSATFRDAAGVEHPGLPLAGAILEDLRKKRDYLSGAKTFGEATFLLKQCEGRTALEQHFRGILQKIRPLPAHVALAGLDFPSYVSFNFDELLETALQERRIEYVLVAEDSDVPHVRGATKPVLKPHGTLSRPVGMKISADETVNLDFLSPLVGALLTTWLAQRTFVFLGFSLSDVDFAQVYFRLKRWLNGHMPRSYAVMRNPTEQIRQYWRGNGLEVCADDVTSFLGSLETEYRKQRLQVGEDLEPWMRHPFFRELLQIRGLPTETQVIEALIAEIRRRIESKDSPSEIRSECLEAVDLVLQHRGNFSALRKVRVRLDGIFGSADDNTDPWASFVAYEHERHAIQAQLAQRAASNELLGEARQVLLYSQSQRVMDCLRAVAAPKQRETVLWIAECRPKSPKKFQDAVSTARGLEGTHYQFRLVPDVVACHLIERGGIERVIMGAHTVFLSKDVNAKFRYFVNTCGASVIARLAAWKRLPLVVVFESEKIEALDAAESQLGKVRFEEEENIAEDAIAALSVETRLAERTRIHNIGYDLIEWTENVSALTDFVP